MKLLSTALAIFCVLAPNAYAQSGVASGMTVTSPQGTSKPLSQWLAGWNVIYPTNTSADVATIQNAVNGTQPVKMAPGTWQVCSQITLPPFRVLEGFYNLSNPGSFGPQQSNGTTIVQCPTNGTFSSGQAFFSLSDGDTIRGLDIYCSFTGNPTFNNINALNAISVEIDHNNLYWCKEGVSRFSDATHAGHSSAYSQLAHIHDNLFYGQIDHGIYGNFVNGGFVSDETYGPHNDFVVIRNAAAIYLNGAASVQIIGDRFEDATLGIQIENSGEISITGNMCDQIGCLKLNNNGNVAIAGNVGHYVNFGGTTDVEFAGPNSVQMSGNSWSDAPIYTCSGGCTLSAASTINEQPAAPTDIATLFADAYTQSVVQPRMGLSNGALASTLPGVQALSQYPGNHVSSRGFSPAVSSCGSSPSVVGDDSSGIITTGSAAPTACTLTFAAAYTYAPVCTLNTSSTSANASLSSAPSTTAFTANLSAALTSGKIYYHCIEQYQNMDPAGAGLAAGWSTSNSTLTAAAGTDPLGGSTAAKITVDNNNNRHRLTNTVQLSGGSTGVNTMSGYFHAGTGSLNPVLAAYDASFFASTIGAIFNITDGSFVGITQHTGAGSIVSTGSQSVGNGWLRVWATFTLGSAPGWAEVQVAQGFNNFFTGNGTDNLLVWGAAMRPGTLP